MQPTSIGPYTVQRELGSGGMGTVYLTAHQPHGRLVAVKVPHPQLVADRDAMRRFEREATAAAQLQHPHIVTVLHMDMQHALPYIAMEFVEGGNLAELLRHGRVLGVAETVRILGPIADALDHCHVRGRTHRDVKPSNVLLGEEGRRPVLTDFGIALVDGHSRHTRTGEVVGTLPYLSPEQAGGASAGRASDLYALACMAFECVTGTRPLVRATEAETLRAQQYDPPPGASVLNPSLGPRVDEVLALALAKDPVARLRSYPRVKDLTDALAAAVAPAPAPVRSAPVAPAPDRTRVLEAPVDRPVVRPSPDPRPPDRRVRAGLILAAAVALVGGPLAYVGADALVDRSTEVSPVDTVAAVVDPVGTATKAGEVLRPDQAELLAQGPVGSLFDCVPQPEVETGTTRAALGCSSRLPGVDSLLLRRDAPGADLDERMDSPGRAAGDCAREVGVDGTWAGGPLSCYDNTRSIAALWWGYRDSGVNYVAIRDDGDNRELYRWFVGTDWSSPAGPPD